MTLQLTRAIPTRTATRRASSALGVSVGAASAAAILALLLVENRRVAILATVAALVLGVVARRMVWLAVMATVGVWVTKRAPGIDVSYTDILVALTGAVALVGGVARSLDVRARLVLRSFTFYLATLTITLLFNHRVRSDMEWFHRIALVAGSILIGAWLVRAGLHHKALRALLIVTVGISSAAIVASTSSGFTSPAQPLGYQKNFIGSITATVLLTLIAAPREFRVSTRMLRISAAVVAGGLLASHSRGAVVALLVGTLVWLFRKSSSLTPTLKRVAVIGAIALSIYAGISIYNELQISSPFTSFNQRIQVEGATAKLWHQHPWTGVGLRFFKTPAYSGYQPPNNDLNEVIAEAGVFGLLGFVVFIGGSLIGLGRVEGPLATAGLCVVAGRFTHGLFDIYWTGGTTTLPWIIAGMGLTGTVSQYVWPAHPPPSP